jgi:hypothetical protein
MTQHLVAVQFLLMRVEVSHGEARSVPVFRFDAFDEAMLAAAELPYQPRAMWEQDKRVDGVWCRIDRNGQGFVIHRIDDPK